jgi:hypothetical protein
MIIDEYVQTLKFCTRCGDASKNHEGQWGVEALRLLDEIRGAQAEVTDRCKIEGLYPTNLIPT